MAFDEGLADRLREVLAGTPEVHERLMFGGIAFMVGGHMACGVMGDELMLRLGREGARAALGRPHVRPMTFTGRPMTTMAIVGPEGVSDDDALRGWVEAALGHVAGLPPKRPRGG